MAGGWLADRFGGKHVFGTGMLVGGVSSLLTPLCARTHPGLLIALRVLMGLCMVGQIVYIMHSALS